MAEDDGRLRAASPRVAAAVDAPAPVVSVRGVVLRFAFAGVVALVIVALGTALVSRRSGTEEAVRDARSLSLALAKGIIEPSLDPKLLALDRGAIDRLDRLVRTSVLRGSLVRVKLWNRDGTILYSDEQRLIGSAYELGSDELATLHGGPPDAELSDLSEPENRFESRNTKLLEVYQPVRMPDGEPLLFETYFRYDGVAEAGGRIWRSFAPVSLGALVLLEMVQIPLAWSMARRLRRNQIDRERLLRHAIDATDQERRRIAADLHDGVVQDLAGVSLGLSAASRRREVPSDETGLMDEAAAEVRRSIKALRSLVVDIYPPNLQQEGLEVALGDLLARMSEREIATELRVLVDPSVLPRDVAALVYRVAQEALRNVTRHADASAVTVTVAQEDHAVVLLVEDDGRGFQPALTGATQDGGHVGLRVLADLVDDAGGKVEVESAPGAGTLIRVEVPTG